MAVYTLHEKQGGFGDSPFALLDSHCLPLWWQMCIAKNNLAYVARYTMHITNSLYLYRNAPCIVAALPGIYM